MDAKSSDAKATLRQALLKKRAAMSETDRQTASAMVVAQVVRLTLAEKPRFLGLYLPVRGEVDLTGISDLVNRVQLALPVVSAMGRGMHFHVWQPRSSLLARNRFGIEEPVGTARVAFGAGDLLLVPCLAIDEFGVRLGYGGGFYDTYLRTCKAKVVAVTYRDFLVQTLPDEAHDVRIKRVVTEKGLSESRVV